MVGRRRRDPLFPDDGVWRDKCGEYKCGTRTLVLHVISFAFGFVAAAKTAARFQGNWDSDSLAMWRGLHAYKDIEQSFVRCWNFQM